MKDPLHRVLVIVAVLTGLRASELAGLQWQCVDFANNRIVVNKRWALGEFGKPKTECSDASVSMGEAKTRIPQQGPEAIAKILPEELHRHSLLEEKRRAMAICSPPWSGRAVRYISRKCR